MNSASEKEVRSWLETCFNKNLKSFDYQITGQTEKGSGYVGDVLFAEVTGVDKRGVRKEYHLVLKCDKPSPALKEKSATFADIYVREIKVYDQIFPYFQQFQREKGVKCLFDSIPRCYGVYSESRFVIVMDNLKKLGYDLYDRKHPLTRKHVDLVVRQYAKFHSISIALKEQKPEEFKRLTQDFQSDPMSNFFSETGFVTILQKVVCELHNLLKDDLPKQTLNKWLSFKDKLPSVIDEVGMDDDVLQVLVHGDCWNNNFMYKYEDDEKSNVSEVAILDWQIAKLASPILDLSYFLFACINPADIADLKTILKDYYNAFCDSLSEMGSTFPKTYSFERFYNEWIRRAKFGVVMCLLPIKVAFAETQDLPDIGESAEKGEDVSASFDFSIKNTDSYKNRIGPIIQYAVENGLI